MGKKIDREKLGELAKDFKFYHNTVKDNTVEVLNKITEVLNGLDNKKEDFILYRNNTLSIVNQIQNDIKDGIFLSRKDFEKDRKKFMGMRIVFDENISNLFKCLD